MRPTLQSTRRISRCLLLSFLPAISVPAITAAQTAATPTRGTDAGKPLAFEVVSIRESTIQGPHEVYGATPDGWHMTRGPMMLVLLSAFTPQNGGAMYGRGQVQGMPDWMMIETYDISAKVAEADLPEWQKHSSQTTMLPAMLQSMLINRCKLTVHRNSKPAPVYSLVVGKSGPKFKESVADTPHPGAQPIPGGGKFLPDDGLGVMSFYDAPISALAAILSNIAGRPVQDKTGLTGLYDIVLHRPGYVPPSADPNAASDPGPTIFSVIEDLGLKLQSEKGSIETLVIDHVERPTEN